jgi:predicted amidophosphoribosyltransferase
MANTGKVRCTKCGTDNPAGMRFCGQCTNPLALICPRCSFENPPGFKFCGQCTAPLASAAGAPAQQSKTSPIRVAETPTPENLDG